MTVTDSSTSVPPPERVLSLSSKSSKEGQGTGRQMEADGLVLRGYNRSRSTKKLDKQTQDGGSVLVVLKH